MSKLITNYYYYLYYVHETVQHNIDGNASKPHIRIFDDKEVLRKYVFDTNLYKVS